MTQIVPLVHPTGVGKSLDNTGSAMNKNAFFDSAASPIFVVIMEGTPWNA
jgi:hypothetical protein